MTAVKQLATGAAEAVTLSTPDGPIAALQAGSAGPRVLLVPGYTGSKEDFAPLLDRIAAQGLHVFAIDLPGQYQSPGPDDPAAYWPRPLGRRVLDVIAELGPPVHLLGHSFGGLVARAAVLQQPAAVTTLVLMGSGPAAIEGARRRRMQLLEPLLKSQGVAAVYEASLAADRAQPGYVEPSAELAAFLRTRFLAGSAAMLQGMGDAIRAEPDLVAELAAAARPILVLHGSADDAWPPTVQADMARRLGANCVVVPDAAHSPAIENPQPTADALLQFWRRHRPT